MRKLSNGHQYLMKKQRKRKLIKEVKFFIILVLIVFAVFYIKNSLFADKFSQSVGFSDVNSSTTENSISIISEEASTQQGSAPNNINSNNSNNFNDSNEEIIALTNDLKTYLKDFDGQYGIYYYNLSSHDEFGINSNEQFVAASTVKIPLNLFLYKKFSEGEADPSSVMPYLKEDFEEGTGILQDESFGKKYTLEELSRLSIVYSDNVAANILFRYLGKWNVKEFMSQVGGIVINDFKNVSSPRDMGLYMRLVYDFYINDKNFGTQLMNSFLNTQFHDRIPALLPKKIKVAHKIGTNDGVANDVGIVFSDKPYVLSIMSKAINENEAPDVIAEISRRIFLFVNK